MEKCLHVYQEMDVDICPHCQEATRRIDWVKEHELQRKWKEDNPDAKYGGWWSI